MFVPSFPIGTQNLKIKKWLPVYFWNKVTDNKSKGEPPAKPAAWNRSSSAEKTKSLLTKSNNKNKINNNKNNNNKKVSLRTAFRG